MAKLTELGAFRTAKRASPDDVSFNLVNNYLVLKDAFLNLCCLMHDALDPEHRGKSIDPRPCTSSILDSQLGLE